MTLFDDRERAFELKYVHDLEIAFRSRLLRTRMMAEWAAEQMGMTKAESDAYVHDQVMALIRRIDDDKLLERIEGDLADRGKETDRRRMRMMMDGFTVAALERLGGLPEDAKPPMARAR
jgi:hypothetical protein